MKIKVLLTAFLALLSSSLIAQAPEEYSFKKAFKVSSPAEMNIKTSDGFIKAYSANTNEILVYFIVEKNNKVQDMDLEELEEHVDVDISSSGNSLEVIITHDQSSWMKNWRDRYNVSFHIIAPKKTDCSLKSSDGNIELMDFVGDQTIRTSDGNINIEGISGSLSARTSDGNIDVLDVSGDVNLHTSDGDILAESVEGDCDFKTSDGKIVTRKINGDIEAITSDGNILLEKVNGDHNARTSDGNIEFEDLTGGFVAQTSDGNIRGGFASLKDKISLKTSDGNISITVPNGLGMDVYLKGEDINMRLEEFSGETSDHKIEGTIRGGGVELELVTSDGDINLNYN